MRASAGTRGSDAALSARSLLFVPGNLPDRIDKALRSGADLTVIDLEDAVRPSVKDEARKASSAALVGGAAAAVRINNDVSGELFDADVAELSKAGKGLVAVVLPMAAPARLRRLRDLLPPSTVVIALVETAAGLGALPEIVVACDRLAFGHLDFATDLRCAPDSGVVAYARTQLALHSRLGDLPAPIDGVTADVRDMAATEDDAHAAVAEGFAGKLCIHPNQVPVVNRAMSPSAEEVSWARAALAAASGTGLAVVDGQMVDAPVLERARWILRRSGVADA
jgi:citrate lyase subunit beta/citryl-CoA lyase